MTVLDVYDIQRTYVDESPRSQDAATTPTPLNPLTNYVIIITTAILGKHRTKIAQCCLKIKEPKGSK